MPYADAFRTHLSAHPNTELAFGLLLLALLAVLSDILVRRFLMSLILTVVERRTEHLERLLRPVINNLSLVVPGLVIQLGIHFVPDLHPHLIKVIHNVVAAYMVVAVVMAVLRGLDMFHVLYNRSDKPHRRSIKGYLQVARLLIYAVAIILVIASLVDRSPLLLLSGLGALAAVLMLVFKDTILSLVASVQLNSDDMLRIGDWIEMPDVNADGEVIDIALHTVKVQNWDKTITTIPTYRLINESFKNWRGMEESGGRRIKRSLLINQNSVRFLSDDERAELRRIMLIDDYLATKSQEFEEYNATLIESGRDPINTRRATNIGTFRAYVLHYLRTHPNINAEMTLLVRQMHPSEAGLPLEIYCFTNTVEWAPYEAIQSDIFDHMLAVLPEFGLRLAQQPTGDDISAAIKAVAE